MTNETEILNAVNLLILEGYLIPFKEESNPSVIASGKLNRLLLSKDIQKPQSTSVVFQRESMTLREFRDRAKIPHQIKGKEFNYTVGAISIPGEKAFNKILSLVDIDRLVDATSVYYNNAKNSRPTLTRYFVEGIWEGVYKEYNQQQTEVANPNFTGERSI